MGDVTIKVMPNGPYVIEGEAFITNNQGEKITTDKPKISLCRCGASEHKPFCDGSHRKINFQAP